MNGLIRKPSKLSSLDLIEVNYESGIADRAPQSQSISWIDHDCLRHAKLTTLNSKETKFFKGIIKSYDTNRSSGYYIYL